MLKTQWTIILGLGIMLGGFAAAEKATSAKKDASVSSQISKEGKILMVREFRENLAELTDAAGQHWYLTGKWREEMIRLDGHKVKVWGIAGAKKMRRPELEVLRYDIIDSGGGHKPWVGILQRKAPQVFALEPLDQNEKTAPYEVKASRPFLQQLDKRVGCKIWVVGEKKGRVIDAYKFGWLYCPVSNSSQEVKEKVSTVQKEKKK